MHMCTSCAVHEVGHHATAWSFPSLFAKEAVKVFYVLHFSAKMEVRNKKFNHGAAVRVLCSIASVISFHSQKKGRPDGLVQ